MNRKSNSALQLTLSALMALTACGGSEMPETPEPTTTEPPAETVTLPPEGPIRVAIANGKPGSGRERPRGTACSAMSPRS
jgi:hypothetical protein